MEYLTTLRQVLESARDLPADADLFLSFESAWALDTPCAILEVDDDGRNPPFASRHGLEYAMSASEVWDVVANVRRRRPNATADLLLRAFLFYFDNNDFLEV